MAVCVGFQENFLSKETGYVVLDIHLDCIQLFLCHDQKVGTELLRSKGRANLPCHRISQGIFSCELDMLVIFVPQGESSWFSGRHLYTIKREMEERIAEQLKHSRIANVRLRTSIEEENG